ncbi:hypothetical protein OG21DRAFT_926041 [Imleria badia]|nr:hypothetical protein OG21DRAFT_926041 [Imleria badia]
MSLLQRWIQTWRRSQSVVLTVLCKRRATGSSIIVSNSGNEDCDEQVVKKPILSSAGDVFRRAGDAWMMRRQTWVKTSPLAKGHFQWNHIPYPNPGSEFMDPDGSV